MDRQYESRRYMMAADDRRGGFMDYLESQATSFDEPAHYLEEGEWMGDPRAPAEGEEHLRTGDNECYYLAQTGMGPGHRYAEGYAVAEDGAIAHAWLVDDRGDVVELSPRLLGLSPDYYGVVFDNGIARDVMIERGQAEPVVEAVA